MSEYEDQIDGNNVICPYCEHSYQREAEDYSEDERIETCNNCDQKFKAWDSFSVNHYTVPDCELNGEQHEWKVYSDIAFEHCDICGSCRRIARCC